MAKTRMKDMLVILPGIMGSVLKRDDKIIWEPGLGMTSNLFKQKQWLDDLYLKRDELTTESVDHVVATGLIESRVLVPGFKKIGGYTELRDKIDDTFFLRKGDPTIDGPPCNYFEFSYDWRRDNRVAAAQLQALIERELPKWQSLAGQDARVILVTHSMGGLVARYYTEVLQGWPNCRELITFGTPYRGSLNALDFIANGYKKMFVDLSQVLRSFPSVYQLLPRYKAVLDERPYSPTAGWCYIHDLDDVDFIDIQRARSAYDDFHEQIRTCQEQNAMAKGYANFNLRPLVGFGQLTFNSAVLTTGGIEASRDLPFGVGRSWSGGDGTVPKVSAVPIEYSDGGPYRFINQQHATLQSDDRLLIEEIAQRLRTMQESISAIRVGERGKPTAGADSDEMPSISLKINDLYLPGEQIVVKATLSGIDDPGVVTAKVVNLDHGDEVDEVLNPDGSDFVGRFELGAGMYRIEVKTQTFVPAVGAVADIFEVS
ncbi:MAG: hypothetical protein OEU26_32805 [Candidatus Tectomicrobia bacterium]|nr:hypothetical protein [Candidatus Tectomicrobia bacterium]